MTAILPIDNILPQLGKALANHNRCLLVAQPGAGKTTRAPLYLLQSARPEDGRWLLLEPRRVAARLAATYMAAQHGEEVGQTVGYRVRGESNVSKHTRLEVVTQGILTRMLQSDPLLEGVAGIIFDEFHERSLEADLGLALALDVQQGLRDDLKLLVMSATLDVNALLAVLGADTPIIDCPGRSWPVETFYRPPLSREAAQLHQSRVIREALDRHEGHVLVFLPGIAEIRRLHKQLQERLPATIDLCPLHGQLSLAQQQAVLRPTPDGKRRIILSTAIAESSLTVPGVGVVIDAGLERVPVFQPRSGLTKLTTRRVNRASADQRRGRAGREAPGFCYRLWGEEQILPAHGEAEIVQADLSGLVFELLRWGVNDPAQLQWVTPPPQAALASGRQLLATLGLADANGALSSSGKACARWPAQPRLAAMLEAAAKHNLLPLACWLCAWLEESPGGGDIDLATLFARRPVRDAPGADGRWFRAARHWAGVAKCSLTVDDIAPLPGLLAKAFPDRIAENQGQGRFRLATGGQAWVAENNTLARAPFIVAAELDGQASGAKVFYGIAISSETLESSFPQTLKWRTDIRWDDSAGRLVGEDVRGLGALVVERRPLGKLPRDAVAAALLSAVRQRGCLRWRADDLQLLGRLRLVHKVVGEPWPALSDQSLLDDMEAWLTPHLDAVTRLDQLDNLPLRQFIFDSLDWQLRRQLDDLAPTHLQVPSGARLALDYSGEEPVLAVKLQEMFGQTVTPTIVGGRVPLLVHLLSPARRPVQVTRDLANFWKTTYFEVRKDLKGRYPKHPWPDNPLQAVATRHTRRHSER